MARDLRDPALTGSGKLRLPVDSAREPLAELSTARARPARGSALQHCSCEPQPAAPGCERTTTGRWGRRRSRRRRWHRIVLLLRVPFVVVWSGASSGAASAALAAAASAEAGIGRRAIGESVSVVAWETRLTVAQSCSHGVRASEAQPAGAI